LSADCASGNAEAVQPAAKSAENRRMEKEVDQTVSLTRTVSPPFADQTET